MKSFSELTSASQVNNDDLLAISQTSGNGYASKKTTVKDITDKSNLNLAEEYDSTSTYAVDDYVIYESVLYKCIGTTTGTFDSTKWTSVVVTDEMGSGGGGGTGGHTIIDENGNSMTARAGLQFVGANVSDDATNNKTIVDLASAGGIDGVFIDTNNVIVPTTAISTSGLSYTATEDCFAYVYLWGGNNTQIKINNIEVGANYASDKDVYIIPLKKGQILTTTSGNENNTYTVYGIQTGTTHSKFQPVIYSFEEREIGVWTDGKPLYQKTYTVPTSSAEISYNSWTNTDIDVSFVGTMVKAFGIALDGSFQGDFLAWNDNGTLKLQSGRNGHKAYANTLTIQYTKSTDVAGSGSWTPQGVPTHHYSTDEQVIGTWVDGRTIYAKTFTGLSVNLNSNDWITINDAVLPVGADIIKHQAYHGDYLVPFTLYAATTDASTGKIRVERTPSITETLGRLYVEYVKASS